MHTILLGSLGRIWDNFINTKRVHSAETARLANQKCSVFPYPKKQEKQNDLAYFIPGADASCCNINREGSKSIQCYECITDSLSKYSIYNRLHL